MHLSVEDWLTQLAAKTPFFSLHISLCLYFLANSWSVFSRSGHSWNLIIFKCVGDDLWVFENKNHVKYVGNSRLFPKMVFHFEVDGISQANHDNQKLQSYHEWNCYNSTTSYHLIPELDIMAELEHSDKSTLHHHFSKCSGVSHVIEVMLCSTSLIPS